jgi:hypothetical protein
MEIQTKEDKGEKQRGFRISLFAHLVLYMPPSALCPASPSLPRSYSIHLGTGPDDRDISNRTNPLLTRPRSTVGEYRYEEKDMKLSTITTKSTTLSARSQRHKAFIPSARRDQEEGAEDDERSHRSGYDSRYLAGRSFLDFIPPACSRSGPEAHRS